MKQSFMRFCGCAVLVIALGAGLGAQQILSGETSPNPAPLGSTISLTVQASIPVYLQSGCGLNAVHQGSPGGPIVYQPFICPAIIIPVGPGSPYTIQWQPGSNVTPGTYYIEVGYRDQATFTLQPPAFFPVRIDGPAAPGGPVLATTGPVMLGGTVSFTIDEPSAPNDLYVLAAAFSTNQGQPLGPLGHLALDQDILWNLSFPVPHPALFQNFQGILDGNGHTGAPQMFIPAVPALQYTNIAFHGAVFTGGTVLLTNPISRTIL